MHIVMLGHSNVGKTSYLSLMYDAMHAGERGFSLRAVGGRHKWLRQQAAAIRRGGSPPGTDRVAAYSMTLRHEGRDVIPVVWHDHRGGAVTGTTALAQTAALLQALRDADGYLLFADAEELATARDRVAARQIQDLVTQLLRVLPDRRGKTTPVVVVLTKTDLVAEPELQLAKLLDHFGPLLEVSRATADLHVAVSPVSCGPKPSGVLRPALWTLCFGLIQHGRELAERMAGHLAQARRAAELDTVKNRILSRFNAEVPSQHALTREHQDSALREWTVVMPLLGHAVHLLGEHGAPMSSNRFPKESVTP